MLGPIATRNQTLEEAVYVITRFFYAPSLTRTIILVKENMSQPMKNSGDDDA